MATPEYLAGWEKELVDKNAAEFRTIVLETPLDSIREPPPCEFCEKPMVKAFVSHSMYATGDHDDKVHLIVGTENMPGYLCRNKDCSYAQHEENQDHSPYTLLSTEGCLDMERKIIAICLESGLNRSAKGFAEAARIELGRLSEPPLITNLSIPHKKQL